MSKRQCLTVTVALFAGCSAQTDFATRTPTAIVPEADVCGDGVRTGQEQCDDGNTVNLDGCDSTCRFEQDQRVNSLTMEFGTDADCTPNALGGAISGLAQGSLQQSLTSGVADGSITLAYKMIGLADLSGSNGPAQIGLVHATPIAGTGYNGNNDLDWWYTTDPTSIDANRNPLQTLSGSLVAHKLTATGASLTLTLILAGSPGQLSMNHVRLLAFTGTPPTASTLSTAGATPGHLAGEHLDPALTSFATTGGSAGTNKLCGDITALSLSHVPAPAQLITGGSNACTQGYTAANSLLDVLVGGCTVNVLFIPITVITATQPDTIGGDKYALAAGAGHSVASCTDNGVATSLATCLAKATYSSYFQFTSDRVILK
jgi:cysteine-rich repeat protein